LGLLEIQGGPDHPVFLVPTVVTEYPDLLVKRANLDFRDSRDWTELREAEDFQD
jgi:hypothetical protein